MEHESLDPETETAPPCQLAVPIYALHTLASTMLGLARSLQAGSRHLTVAIRSAVHVAARSPVPVSQFGLLRVRSSLPVTITALDARSFPDSALASDVSQALFQLRACVWCMDCSRVERKGGRQTDNSSG